jgi:multidrug efflux pump subunit AcrA (membrane-fusion protein)
MEKLRKKNTVIIAIVLLGFLIYLGYRVVESRKDTTSLTKQAMENDVPTVAIVHAEPLPAKETIQLPGTIEAWFQAPIYAQVSGYVKMWHKDWGGESPKRRYP